MNEPDKSEVIIILFNSLIVKILLYKRKDDLRILGAMKIQAKIMMNKELNNYDGLLTQLRGKEEIELSGLDKEISMMKENTNTENQDKAKSYDLGFLQSKVIKKIFFCLNERQQIGRKLSSNNSIP